MKKTGFFLAALLLIAVFVFTACGSKDDNHDGIPDDQQNTIEQDVEEGADDAADDLKNGADDLKDDAEDLGEDIKEDIDKAEEDIEKGTDSHTDGQGAKADEDKQ